MTHKKKSMLRCALLFCFVYNKPDNFIDCKKCKNNQRCQQNYQFAALEEKADEQDD